MLYGNLRNALPELTSENPMASAAATELIWLPWTDGQRTSGRDKAVVKSGGARADWVWTLAGSGKGSKPLDVAYQVARDRAGADIDLLAPEGSGFLPAGITGDEAHQVCSSCPVRDRCLEATLEER